MLATAEVSGYEELVAQILILFYKNIAYNLKVSHRRQVSNY
jgi:hypothetical protein